MREFKAKFDGTSQQSITDLRSFWQKEEDQRQSFNTALNPSSSKHFLYFKAIQGHSGGNLVDPALQDNVPMREDFTEYIYHIGNVSQIHSVIGSGLIPGGRSLKRDKQSVFFTTVNPMDDDQFLLGQAKDRSIQKYLDTSSEQCIGAI